MWLIVWYSSTKKYYNKGTFSETLIYCGKNAEKLVYYGKYLDISIYHGEKISNGSISETLICAMSKTLVLWLIMITAMMAVVDIVLLFAYLILP